MNRFLAGLRGYVTDARTALRHAPAEVALGWLIALSASWAIAVDDAGVLEAWTRLGVTVAIAIPLVFGASILRAAGAVSSTTRWLITTAALVAGGVYGAFVFERVIAEAWRSWLLVGASVAALALTPVLMPREPATGSAPPWNALSEERARFWIFFQRVVARFITVYGLALLLAIGLSLAIASVDTLFNLHAADEETYFHTFAFVVLGVGTWAMAGGAPELAEPVVVDRELALIRSRRVGLYLLLPLLLVYTAILYAYVVRIVYLRELPQNLISPLVLAAGGMWLAGAIVLEPFHWLEEQPIAARIIRFYPWLAGPLVALGVWALWIRVDQYGWTEFRYVRLAALAAIASLAVTGVARRLTHRPPILREIPFTAALLLLVAAVGPWGAPAVALRSQQERLSRLAPAAELAATEASTLARAPLEAETEAADVIRYLRDHFGEDALEGVASEALVARLDSLNLLWGGRRGPEGEERVQIFANIDLAGGVPGVPAGTLYRFGAWQGRPRTTSPEGPVAYVDGLAIRIDVAGRSLTVPLGELTASMVDDARARQSGGVDTVPTLRPVGVQLTPARVLARVEGEAGEDAGIAILEHITLDLPADGALEGARLTNVSGFLVLAEPAPPVDLPEAGR